MNAAMAVRNARAWVQNEARVIGGYCGAYLSGSILDMAPEADFPPDSDVDVVLLIDGEMPPKIGKMRHGGTLIEITMLPKAAVADFSEVMSTHYLAFALNGRMVLDDPQGFLRPLAERVHDEYFQEEWLLARVQSTAKIARRNLSGMTGAATPEARLMSCGFGPSAIALPVLASAGRNCTVRKRLPKAREALREAGFGGFARRLEEALGCEGLTAVQLLPHMDAIERIFCRAMDTQGPSASYPFRSDIRPDAKAVAIDGTREMLMGKNPSDAVFWMIATLTRSMTILHMDDAAAYAESLPDMQSFASLLGVESDEKASARQVQAMEILSEAEEIARTIAKRTAERARQKK